jgi:osmotically-inducible protein OsmY
MRTRWQQFSAWGMVVLVAMILFGYAAMTGRQSPGEAVSDSTITTKVKTTFLGDPVVSGMAIDADTNDGVVVLTGFVTSEQERQRAIQLAQSVEGVKRVDGRNLVIRR